MTIPTLIFICVTAFTVLMCLWATASTLLIDPEHSSLHRLVTAVCAIGLLVMTAAAACGPQLGCPRLVWASVLLPVLVLGATWSNVVTLGNASVIGRLLAAPLLIYNLLLAGMYSASALQECIGLDLGTWGCALVSADVQLQTVVGHPSAVDSPIWLRLPIVLPIWAEVHLFQFSAMFAGSFCSAVLMFVLAGQMPKSFHRSSDYHKASPKTIEHTTPVGVMVPWGKQLLSESQTLRIRVHAKLLGARHISFEVDPDTFRNKQLTAQVEKEVEWATGLGLDTVAIIRPSAQFKNIPALSLNALRRDMEQTQWLAAEKFAPDLMVLFTGPLAGLNALIAQSTKVDDWFTAIEKSAHEVREASKDTKLVVALENFDYRAAELFHKLKSSDSPVDVVGFAIFPTDSLVDLERKLGRLKHWCQTAPGNRPVRVTECRCGPQINGGERGQWNFVSRVVKFAETTEAVGAVSVDGLYALDCNTGLISWAGKRRLTYRELERAAHGSVARPGK